MWERELRTRWDALEPGDPTRLTMIHRFFNPSEDNARAVAAAAQATAALSSHGDDALVGAAAGPAVWIPAVRFAEVAARAAPSVGVANYLAHVVGLPWSDAEDAKRFRLHLCEAGLFRFIRDSLAGPDPAVRDAAVAVLESVLRDASNPELLTRFGVELLTGRPHSAVSRLLANPAVYGTLVNGLDGSPQALREVLTDANPTRATWLLANLVEVGIAGKLFGRITTKALAHVVAIFGELLPLVPQKAFAPVGDDGEMDMDLDDDDDDSGGGGGSAVMPALDVPIEPEWRGLPRLTGIDFARDVIRLLRASDRPLDVEAVCQLINLALDRCDTALQRATLLSVVAFEPGLVVHLWGLIAARRELLDKFVAGTLADYRETVSYLRLFAGAYVHPPHSPPPLMCVNCVSV